MSTSERLSDASWRTTATLVTAVTLLLAPRLAAAEPHTVRAGETLGGIAKSYHCTVDALKKENRLAGDLIQVGQALEIPVALRGRDPQTVTHVVVSGDTLSGIAERYGVTVDHLRDMNRAVRKKGATIRVGQKLTLVPQKPVRERHFFSYRIEAGDTLIRIAKRFELSLDEILALNPKKDPDKLRIGDKLQLYREGPENPSRSVGRPQNGTLEHGEQLANGAGYFRRRPGHAWGTNFTVQGLREAIAEVVRAHPDDVAIGDISAEKGGRLVPHKSHQTGRDVDIGFWFKDQPRSGPKAFLMATNHPLHYEAIWTFLMDLAGTDDKRSKVDYVFISYPVQKKLYQWAQKAGKDRRTLERLFQYPSGLRAMRGIVRHEPGHVNHMHIRFKCARGDSDCS